MEKVTELTSVTSYRWARYPSCGVWRIERPQDWTEEQWAIFCREVEEEFESGADIYD